MSCWMCQPSCWWAGACWWLVMHRRSIEGSFWEDVRCECMPSLPSPPYLEGYGYCYNGQCRFDKLQNNKNYTWRAFGMHMTYIWHFEFGRRSRWTWISVGSNGGLNGDCIIAIYALNLDVHLAYTWRAFGKKLIVIGYTWHETAEKALHMTCIWHAHDVHLASTWRTFGIHMTYIHPRACIFLSSL